MPEPLDQIADLTPQWLAEALQAAGEIEGSIHALTVKAVGTGQMADSFRVSIQGDKALPASVIIKMQAADELARAAGAGSAYRSEVGYYTDLCRTVAMRTPHCYCAVGPDEGARFALVLEDMAPAQQGDQIPGCTLDQAFDAVVNLAGLHGPRWCDRTLLQLPWLRRVAQEEAEFFQTTLIERTEIFIDYYRDRISESDIDVLQHFAPRCGAWLMDRSERFTLVHGDYRLDNLLFGGAEMPIATVDWQTLEVGNPGRDLGYFLGNSLLPEERQAQEQALVSAYHEALESHGVSDYSFATCYEDYRFGQFQGPLITVLAAASLTHTERGDDMFVAMCRRACQAIRDSDSLEYLSA